MTMRLIFTFLTAVLCFQLLAQKPDTLQVPGSDSPPSFFPIKRDTLLKDKQAVPDTLVLTEKKKGVIRRVFSKNYPNPRMAALLSFALPGAGQAYNKKWWKIPLAWGALGVENLAVVKVKAPIGRAAIIEKPNLNIPRLRPIFVKPE